MSFFNTLGRILSGRPRFDEQQQRRLLSAWGLDDPNSPLNAAPASAYDQAQWHKKLKSMLEKLPGSQARWGELMTEVRALNLDPDWIQRALRAEFTLLVRRLVANRVVTPEEHQRIDLARRLVGLSEAEAEDILLAVVAETEAFFGEPVVNEIQGAESGTGNPE